MEKPILSANFKKDYIAYSAVVIFFMIISLELFMAVFIPAHLQIEGVWSEEVARQEMIERFDGTRNGYLNLKSKFDCAEEEAQLLAESMTPLADYLREYQYKIGLKEIKEIDKAMSGMRYFFLPLREEGAYSADIKLETKKFIKTLEKEMAKTK